MVRTHRRSQQGPASTTSTTPPSTAIDPAREYAPRWWRTLGWSALVAAPFVLVVIGLGLGHPSVPWVHWAFPPEHRWARPRPDGPWWQAGCLVAGLGLGVLVTVATAPRPPKILRWVGLGATGAAAVGLTALAPVLAEDLGGGGWTRIPVGLLGAALVVRLAIVVRVAAGFRRPSEHPDVVLLAHQQDVVDRLGLPPPRGAAGTIQRRAVKQLVGRWGEGKSFLVGALDGAYACEPTACLRRSRRPSAVLVVVDVWKHAGEADLHKAIVREILSHPALVLPWGWLTYPLGMVSEISIAEARVKATLSQAEVDGTFAMPRLAWQRPLERALRWAVERNTQVVVVLDEVDRASAQAAQAAVTLTERSLDRPGLVVVLSYVEEVLPHKVVSPFVEQLDDLRSTTTATILHLVETSKDGWEGFSKDLLREPSADAPLISVEDALRRAYVRLSPDERSRFRSTTTEKLMDTDRVRLPAVPPEVFHGVLSWPGIEGSVQRILGDVPPPEDVVADVARHIFERTELPPLRALRSALQHELALVDDVSEPDLAALGDEGRRLLLVFLLLAAITAANDAQQGATGG